MNIGPVLHEIFNFINANGAAVGIVTFVIGLLWGHRQAIGRDKRKEFNEVALPLQIWLRKQLELNSVGRMNSRLIAHDDLIRLSILMSRKERARFEDAVSQYERSFKQSGHVAPDGSGIITNLSAVTDATLNLLGYCKLK